MRTAGRRILMILTGIAAGAAVALVIPRGRQEADRREPQPLPAVSSDPSLRVEILGLPAIAYVGENLNYILRVENLSNRSRPVRISHSDGWTRRDESITLPPSESADIPIPFRAGARVAAAPASVTVARDDDTKRILWQGGFWFRDGRGDLADVVAEGRACANARKERVVLVNSHEDETQYRRWAPVKWAARRWEHLGAPAAIWTAASLANPDEHGGIRLIPYSGDPLAACLRPEPLIPAGGSALLCLAWGFDEASGGYPARDFARALDLAVDRLRILHPSIQLALATPPPSPSQPDAVERFAESVRKVAREHHAPLIDLHSFVLRQPEWIKHYALDGDPNIIGRYPQAQCLKLIHEQIGREL